MESIIVQIVLDSSTEHEWQYLTNAIEVGKKYEQSEKSNQNIHLKSKCSANLRPVQVSTVQALTKVLRQNQLNVSYLVRRKRFLHDISND